MSGVLKLLGTGFLVVAFIGGVWAYENVNTTSAVVLGLSNLISGILFLAFGSVLDLLTDIRDRMGPGPTTQEEMEETEETEEQESA